MAMTDDTATGGATGTERADQEMAVDEEQQDEERKASNQSEDSAGGGIDEDSDEEDSNMIPDEKPAIGDTTANELDLLEQINMLESEEKNLGEEVLQKEALLDKIKQ